MTANQQAVAVFNKWASQYQQRYQQQELYVDGFEQFCNLLPAGAASVLELACGPGNITRYLLQLRPELKILGTDLSPNMLQLAAAANPSATFRLLDCMTIDQLTEKYEGILCGFGLPYLNKAAAVELIAAAAGRLKSKGVLYLSTMEGPYEQSGLQTGSTGDSIFIHFHEAQYLEAAMLQSGFNIVSMQRKQYNTGDQLTTDLILIGQLQ